MVLKYCVVGGWLISKTDADRHYVNAKKLCKLYGVNPEECMLYEEAQNMPISTRLPILRPRLDGNYSLRNIQ